MDYPVERRYREAVNADTWTQILLGIGHNEEFKSSSGLVFKKHGYVYWDKTAKEYVVSWDRERESHNKNYEKLSFQTIIENTGKYINSIKTTNAAPEVRTLLEYAHQRRVKEVKEQYCLFGRTIYRFSSFIKNFFKGLGCHTTEQLALRYARSLPKGAIPA